MVMTAHIIYETLDSSNPSTLSKKILTEYLREKLGFQGVIITDSFNMWAIQKNYDPGQAAIRAIQAGADMIMLAEERYGEHVKDYKKSQIALMNRIEKAVMDGEITMKRINESYNRIKNLKEKYNLADRLPVDVEKAIKTVGKSENTEKAVRAAEAALITKGNFDELNLKGRIAITRLAKENIKEIVRIAEGIGPNYYSAYEDFVKEMKAKKFDLIEFNEGENIPESDMVIALSENYPLPGKSLDLSHQANRLKKLMQVSNVSVIECSPKRSL